MEDKEVNMIDISISTCDFFRCEEMFAAFYHVILCIRINIELY